MTDNEAQKKIMRETAKSVRHRLMSSARDEALADAFFSTPYCNFGRIFLYLSTPWEADTSRILERLLRMGKCVLVPKTEGVDMFAVPYCDDLRKNDFGIREPVSGADMPCDVALVPLLAFDKRGNRLGYGGGYYDRYFHAHPSVLRVGLAYAGQAVPSVPADAWDVPLQAVVTEEGTLFLDGEGGMVYNGEDSGRT